MDFAGALRARLINNVAVTALVEQRVTWVDRPQETALPAVTLQLITEERPQSMSGLIGQDKSTVQIDCWSKTHLEASNLKEAVIAALLPAAASLYGVKFDRAFVDTIRDLGERTETQFVHRASIDMIFYHSQA